MSYGNELHGLNAQHKHIAQHEERNSWVNSQRAQMAENGASTTGDIQRRKIPKAHGVRWVNVTNTSADTASQSRSEIPKALDLLSENTATLGKMLTELEQRLAPVLQAPYPEQETEAVLKTSDIPMVNTLTHGVVSIKRTQDRVADIIGRLAL